MAWELVFAIFMLIYWLSEGCTEGYTWAKDDRRKQNKLIFGQITNGVRSGDGILDYHAWRLGENIGMVGCIFSAYHIRYIWNIGFTFIGSWMLGYFVYEKALNYICHGKSFTNKGAWKMMGIELQRSGLFDCIVAIIGVGLILLGIYR